jgi:hypothetical protein
LLAYLALQVLVLLPYVSMTASMRQIVLLAIDVGLPYFVLSRACRNREIIAEAMAAFVMRSWSSFRWRYSGYSRVGCFMQELRMNGRQVRVARLAVARIPDGWKPFEPAKALSIW